MKTSSSLALINFTQNAIFNAGLIGVMCLAAQGVQNGNRSYWLINLKHLIPFY